MTKSKILCICLIVFMMSSVSGQIIKTKLDFVGGIGYPEYLHAGARYQYMDEGQIGVYYGGGINKNSSIVRTWNIDNMYHFGKNSFISNRPVWYGRAGFTYSIHTASDRKYKYSLLDFAAGRDFAVNNWLGFNADMGIICQLREKREFEDPSKQEWFNIKLAWLPLVRIQVYISL